jgi:hypothetical protein
MLQIVTPPSTRATTVQVPGTRLRAYRAPERPAAVGELLAPVEDREGLDQPRGLPLRVRDRGGQQHRGGNPQTTPAIFVEPGDRIARDQQRADD